MKKRIVRVLMLAICISCLLSAVSVSAYAIDPIDLNASVSLTVEYVYGTTAISDAKVSLYRVADTDRWANFTLCGSFAGYSGSINGFETASDWDKAAKTLTAYASNLSLTPRDIKTTDSNGLVRFSSGMTPGLYLVVLSPKTVDKTTYSANPCLVCVPGRDPDTEKPLYETVVIAKPNKNVVPPSTPPYLPQTGQLWWPVPMLLCGGLFLLLVGAVKRRSRNDEEA